MSVYLYAFNLQSVYTHGAGRMVRVRVCGRVGVSVSLLGLVLGSGKLKVYLISRHLAVCTIWPRARPCKISSYAIHTAGRAIAIGLSLIGRPFIKRFALCYRSVVCLSCLSCLVLSVTLVYCGQAVGLIKMKLGMQVGLGPGYLCSIGTQLPP